MDSKANHCWSTVLAPLLDYTIPNVATKEHNLF